MLKSAFLLAKIGADTTENERNLLKIAKNWQHRPARRRPGRSLRRRSGAEAGKMEPRMIFFPFRVESSFGHYKRACLAAVTSTTAVISRLAKTAADPAENTETSVKHFRPGSTGGRRAAARGGRAPINTSGGLVLGCIEAKFCKKICV